MTKEFRFASRPTTAFRNGGCELHNISPSTLAERPRTTHAETAGKAQVHRSNTVVISRRCQEYTYFVWLLTDARRARVGPGEKRRFIMSA